MRTLKVLQTKNRKKSISNIILTVLTIICISASASFALSRNNTLENDYLTQIDGSLMTDNPSTEEIVAMTEYDGRNYGLVTPIKSQGDTNLCWAYSSVSASETSILKSRRNRLRINTCLKKICRKGNRLRRKTPRRETRKREKNAIEISMLKKITPGGATVF